MFLPWTWPRKRVPARRRRGLRPQLEVLEARLQPSIVAASPSDAKINTSSPLGQTTPSVAMDANGDYVVAWNNQVHLGPNYLYDVDARVYNSAGQAQTGEIVVAQTPGDTRPSVAMDANGDFVVAYQVLNTTTYDYGISAQRYNLAGTPQGSTLTVNDGSSPSATGSLPKVAMDSAGDFTIAFQGYDANSHGVFAQQFNSSGTSQGAIFRVNTPQTDNQGAPTIAMDSAGDFVIAWEDGGPTQNAGIYAQRYNPSGVAQGSNTAISTVTSGSSPGNPSVAMEPTGQYAIAWQFDQTAAGAGNGFQGIETQRFDASGNALTSVVQLNTPENYNQGGPSVAIDSEGDFVVAWESYGTGGTASSLATILAQRVNSEGTLIGTTQFTPSTQSGDNQRDPAVASDPNGNTIIVWESQPSSTSDAQNVYGRLYNYVNDAPTINTPSNVTINENAGQQTVNLTGITAGGGETQTLTVTASSDNIALVNPSVTYTSPNSTGTLRFTPAANSFGTATITVTVTDNGGTLNGGVDTTSVQFTVTVNEVAAPATHFTVSTPTNTTAGTPFNVTVTALDASNNTATGYTGTMHFTSSDGQAVLPADSTLTNGVGTFSATLKTAGNQTITATDTTTSSITGTSNTIAVAAAAASHFSASAPTTATAGTAFNATVTALDAFDNTATGYTGTVNFTSSDGQAVLPADSTLTNGVGTFSATLKTAGNQTITATDTTTSSITGTSNTIAVAAAAASHFSASAPTTATAGTSFSLTVTALDQFDNTATGYSGTVNFTSSDGQAVLPADSTLTNGVGTFSATLKTAGNQTITATDTTTSSITGTSNTIAVAAARHRTSAASAPDDGDRGHVVQPYRHGPRSVRQYGHGLFGHCEFHQQRRPSRPAGRLHPDQRRRHVQRDLEDGRQPNHHRNGHDYFLDYGNEQHDCRRCGRGIALQRQRADDGDRGHVVQPYRHGPRSVRQYGHGLFGHCALHQQRCRRVLAGGCHAHQRRRHLQHHARHGRQPDDHRNGHDYFLDYRNEQHDCRRCGRGIAL